ncbi:lipase family protein [Pseudanabaena sp. PCC 6802]|uniref:lipase family protein n=1 Tax=Pseudanabaena sp. PCC 6802 TaxID=118173 RepID=UPI00034C3C19|nr:lipase family protein [Pseudanabaena sp. PCC 6802]
MTQKSNYDPSQAGVQMTLSAIAYADENGDYAATKTAIENELAKSQYATGGNWKLVWGPGITDKNLMYVAQNQLNPDRYSLAIRGTDFDFFSNIKEDFWVSQVKYPYATSVGSALMVSNGALFGLQNLQKAIDPSLGQTLEDYLKMLVTNSSVNLVVTGHSLGGCLASLALIWLYDTIPTWSINANNMQLSGYTFAAPTAGNSDFANYFDAKVGSNCFRVVNPLDVVPHAWAGLSTLITKHIPTNVPLLIDPIIIGAAFYLKFKGWIYQQLDTEIHLREVQIPSSVDYLDQVEDQHDANSYLYLLGAPQTDLSPPSPLSKYDKNITL